MRDTAGSPTPAHASIVFGEDASKGLVEDPSLELLGQSLPYHPGYYIACGCCITPSSSTAGLCNHTRICLLNTSIEFMLTMLSHSTLQSRPPLPQSCLVSHVNLRGPSCTAHCALNRHICPYTLDVHLQGRMQICTLAVCCCRSLTTLLCSAY